MNEREERLKRREFYKANTAQWQTKHGDKLPSPSTIKRTVAKCDEYISCIVNKRIQ